MWGTDPAPPNPFDGRESIQGASHPEEISEGFGFRIGDVVFVKTGNPFEPRSRLVVKSIAQDGSYVRDKNGRIFMTARLRTLCLATLQYKYQD